MPRTGSAFLFMLAIMSLASVAPASGWAQGTPINLTNNTQHDSGPVWSPDGTKIAFESDRDGDYEIYVMNADGTNPVQLTRRGARDFGPARWSPDGTKIAFASEPAGHTEIYVVNADGTGLVRLTQSDGHDGAPAWSPDGTKIAFESNRDGDYEIYVMDADGTNLVRLTRGDGGGGSPAWSPDGTKIAFTSARTGEAKIYVMDADGTNLVRLTQSDGHDQSLAWSPDGAKIAFISYRTRGFEIYVMNADGTNLVELTQNAGGGESPVWSPDGTKIAFDSYRDGDYEIYVMNADGTNLVRLTQSAGQDGSPAWSPDGTKIAFESDRDGDNDIYVIPYGPAAPTPTDHGDTRERATAVGPDSTTVGALEQPGDVDYFRVDVTQAGRLTVETTGGTDTAGVFQSAQGRSLAEDDDAGTGNNFRIARDVTPGRYYVAVRGASRSATGAYTLRLAFTPAEDQGNTERGDRRATLLNLSPWQAWVHLYCLKDQGTAADPPAPCAVTFECNSFSGEPVMWPVEVAPKTIFSYWPNKTETDGTAADLHAALVAAGKTEEEARRRTTCEVFSPDPVTVRGYTLFGGQPTLVPVAEPARPAGSTEPGERRRQATLPNLSPWQAWVHLYCLKDRAGPDADPPAPCAVTFECNGQSGEPVTWPVEVAPKTIFSYWPNKTVDGMTANLQAALIAAGKPEEEARRRTTCEVSSADPIAVRGYTRFNGQPTLVPVTEY